MNFHPSQNGNPKFILFRMKSLSGLHITPIVSNGVSEDQAKKEAIETIENIFNYHPDMNPLQMDDGNILVQYNHPAYNVVLDKVAKENIYLINKMHQKALTRDEVLITPLGPNKFDEFGMKALFGRCYFFMDAKNPIVSKIIRKKPSEQPAP
jgi:hypothetical protein